MKMIKWLTEEQVAKAAGRGRKAALLCSIKHWEQLSTASKSQISKLPPANIRNKYCALCMKCCYIGQVYACRACGLNCLQASAKRNGIWYRASCAFDSYQEHPCEQGWMTWKRVSKAILRRIIKLYEKEYGLYKQRQSKPIRKGQK